MRDRYREAGGYTIAIENSRRGDSPPFCQVLPDDGCRSHHWGYVAWGRLIMNTPAGGEAGEAYCTLPAILVSLLPGRSLWNSARLTSLPAPWR